MPRAAALCGHGGGFAEGDQPVADLVPEGELGRAEALEERQPSALAQFGEVAKDLTQPVERNLARQMMDVVDADIGGEPAQGPGQVIVRAAMEGAGVEVPLLPFGPMGLLELVL